MSLDEGMVDMKKIIAIKDMLTPNKVYSQIGSIFAILKIYFVLKEVKHFSLGNPGGFKYLTGEGR